MKATKKTLLMSVLSLVLCCTMLLGTTMAWFTDKVENGNNTIKAGNLDVEIYHKDGSLETAEAVTETTALFDDVALWEPGAYAYETFTIKNVGNLALQYSMKINASNATVINEHSLDEILKVAVVEEAPSARTLYEGASSLKGWSYSEDECVLYPAEAEGMPDGGVSEKTFTVVVYWFPTDDDNLWNVGGETPLSVDLGIELTATQYTFEADSFDNQYDAAAGETTNTDLANTSWDFSASGRPETLTAFPTTGEQVTNGTYGTGYRYWVNIEYKIGNATSTNTPSITFYPETQTIALGGGYFKPYQYGSWANNVEVFNITTDTTVPGRDVDKNNPELINWFQENFGAAEYQDPNAVEVDPFAP